MNTLKDLKEDDLLAIFKMMRLDERTKLRAVNHHWKELIDSIKIKKLAVFEKMKPAPGKLEGLNEDYKLEDCVYVTNLDGFFSNRTILNQMELIEYLEIIGIVTADASLELTALNFQFNFKKLKYLRVHNVTFTNLSFAQCPIEYLICSSRTFDIDKFNNILSLINIVETKKSKIKYLSTSHVNSRDFTFYHLFGLLHEVECIRLFETDFDSMAYLIGNFDSLKELYCNVYDDFIDLDKWIKQVEKIRPSLSVYLYGIKLTKSNIRSVIRFVSIMNKFLFRLRNGKNEFLNLVVNPLSYGHIKKAERKHDLSNFFKQFKGIQIDSVDDVEFFNKFTPDRIFLGTFSPASHLKYQDLISRIKEVHVSCLTKRENVDEILRLISENCNTLLYDYVFISFKKVDLKFLPRSSRVSRMELLMPNEFEETALIDFIGTNRYLLHMEVIFPRKAGLSKERLIELKNKINDYLQNEIKRTNLEFKIEIHRYEFELIKYIIKEKNTIERFVMHTTYKGILKYINLNL